LSNCIPSIIVAAISAFLVSILIAVYLRRRAYYIRLNAAALAEMQNADANSDVLNGSSSLIPMGLRVRYDRFGFQEREVWDHLALRFGEKDRPKMIEVEVRDQMSTDGLGRADGMNDGRQTDSTEAKGEVALVDNVVCCLFATDSLRTRARLTLTLPIRTALPSSAHHP
jgi:hypothetical protein